jgi:ferrochelatase
MYDSILVVSFGGPEKPEDVMPFLENVTRGRGIPAERLREVAEHYYHFGGKSPINDQCRELIAALRPELSAHSINLPIYWGNRNWHPFLADTLRQMRADGRKHALALVTSAYSSYSGCRQYRENIAAAQAEVGEGAPRVDKIRVFYNHPGFVEAMTDRVQAAMKQFPESVPGAVHFVATAHSIPCSMADTSDYVKQLKENLRLVTESVGLVNGDLVFQSRSGPPTQPWLEPDILDHLRHLHSQGVKNVLVAPIGFISDHLEVLFDLDTEALDLAEELGMHMVRVPTAGTHPAFIRMLRQLIAERLSDTEPKLAMGLFPPNHDVCPVNCCPPPQRPPARPSTGDKPPVSANPSVSPRP